MTNKELTIGDYVYHNGRIVRVSLLSSNDGYLAVTDDEESDYTPFETVKPIEITPVILMHNDFDYNQEEDNYKYEFISTGSLSYRIHISYIENRKCYNMGIVTDDISIVAPVRYVHELQHALSFCRINKKIGL